MTIDWWTLGIQTVNVLILIWLLHRFFWRPVAAMIEQRRTATKADLAAAVAKSNEAATALADIAHTRAGFAQEREAILTAAHEEAERARSTSLADATKEAAALTAAATASIETQRGDVDKAWTARAAQLSVEIAGRLASRLDGAAVRASFLDWLLEAIRTLPEAARHSVAASGASLEAVSATPLDPADQERYAALIGTSFGARPPISFKVDPALIAGIEVHGPHFTVGNSWRADLKAVLADIDHDDRR